MGEWPIFLRFALREMRGGLQGFYIFLACLALGVAAIAGVGSTSAAFQHGIQSEGRAILGGDVSLELNYRDATPAELGFLHASGKVSQSQEMRVMVKNTANAQRTLAELKAVDGAYPLYGSLALSDGGKIHARLARRDGVWGMVMEASLASRLGALPGAMLQMGEETFQLRGVIAHEPDRASGNFALSPRAIIAMESLQATQLIQPGSLTVRRYRIRLPEGTDLKNWTDALSQKFPDANWRIRQHNDSAPGTQRFLEQMSMFMNLSAMTALVAAGVGVGNAVSGYLHRKRAAIAVMKCIGASGAVIFRIYMTQILLLTLFALGVGLCVGIAIPFLLEGMLTGLLPLPANFAIYPLPLVYAVAFGVCVSALFAIWPLARAQEIPAGELFRALVEPTKRWPRPVYLAAMALIALLLMLLAFASAGNARFAGWFVAGAAVSFLALGLLGAGLVRLAARLPRPRQPELRMALGNIHRPGSFASAVLLSLGIGLSLLTTLAAVEGNISHLMNARAEQQAPNLFFLDIQAADIDEFLSLARAQKGVSDVVALPSLRGRITRIGGASAVAADVAQEAQWAISSDRILSYAAAPPTGTVLTAGAWWPADYEGPALLSLDAELARGMGLQVGDSLTVTVLGREVEARIASLRRIDWSDMQVNFALIFSPGAFAGAPHSYLATARTTPETEDFLYKTVTDRFPGVSAVQLRETLETVNGLIGSLAMAVRAAGSVTLVLGVLVLAGALAAGNARRVYDAVVLKVLGAARSHILRAYALEYAILGLSAALLASGIGSLAAWLIVTELMRTEFVFLPGVIVLTAGISLTVTVFLGLSVTWRALKQKPASLLRASE